MKDKSRRNIAFIDGQNLHMGTAKREIDPWKVDLYRFRKYLTDKYRVKVAYYYVGLMDDGYDELYDIIQRAGFLLRFRPHSASMTSTKKGNVDSDIIFHIMKALYKRENFDKIFLVSGDGDYKLLVDFLIEEGRFSKILLPWKRSASSLYKEIGGRYVDHLDYPDIRDKIEKKKRGP